MNRELFETEISRMPSTKELCDTEVSRGVVFLPDNGGHRGKWAASSAAAKGCKFRCRECYLLYNDCLHKKFIQSKVKCHCGMHPVHGVKKGAVHLPPIKFCNRKEWQTYLMVLDDKIRRCAKTRITGNRAERHTSDQRCFQSDKIRRCANLLAGDDSSDGDSGTDMSGMYGSSDSEDDNLCYHRGR